MSNRTLQYTAIGVATVAVILAVLLSGSALAQEGGSPTPTPTPAPPTGKLVVAPQSVERGRTTLAVGFHVTPRDLEVKIEYSGHFIPEGESCDDAGTSGTTQSAVAPTWVTLNACTVGETAIRLVAADTGAVIEKVSVTVVEPTVGGQGEGGEGQILVRLSGVDSSMEVGDSDSFTVSAGRLDSDEDYDLYIESLDASSLAFDRSCSDFTKTVDVSGVSTYSGSHTVYACDSPGTNLWAYIRLNGLTVGSSGMGTNYVTVTEPPTPVPTDTPTPTPTPMPTDTPTPTPPQVNPRVSFSPASYLVGEESSVSVTVRRSRNTSGSLRIPIRVTHGSADDGDYTVSGLSNGRLSFRSGDRFKSFTIRADEDDDCDDETVNVGFGNLPSGVDAGSPSSATVTIDDADECIPDKVVNLSGTSGPGHGEVTLAWNAVNHATGYEVRQKPSSSTSDQWIALPSAGFEVEIVGTTAVARNLDPDTTYEHQVRGTNVDEEGEWSDSVETTPNDERPHTPRGLIGESIVGGRGLSLSWRAVAGAVGYEIESSSSGMTMTYAVPATRRDFFGLTPETVYDFRVRARKRYGGSHLYSRWSSAMGYTAPTPTNVGHQEDHTVEYDMGSITSAPGLPAGVDDPATVISAAIGPAAEAWNTAAEAIAGKNLKICEVLKCGVSNHDMGTITIKTVDMNTRDTGLGDNSKHAEGCGSSVACVKASTFGQGNHLGDMSLIIEEPAWECQDVNDKTGACVPGKHVRIYWTDKSGLDGSSVPGIPNSYYYYIGPTMIHEFGHTLGLSDFYSDTVTGLMGLRAVMDDPSANKMITAEDIRQLRAIYLLHDSSDH